MLQFSAFYIQIPTMKLVTKLTNSGISLFNDLI